ncbi:uncharacterized protein LOC126371631 [Pectinophora gossypiella]|uniref:uncharacterized protein LOC126371631 n=1 Tax=Pectinophora gossypiella TaxID=13191 RepID=UPI00214E69FB|nr:uncharacterized protein LOC126371631 [Pectinophora gossypiella]
MGSAKKGAPNLYHTYYFYAALLAVKLLSLLPLGHCMCSVEKFQKANMSDLKHLTPFWLLAGLFVTTSPDPNLAINLMRAFAVARFVSALGYICDIPKCATEGAFFVSFTITSFMGAAVVWKYSNAI